MNKRRLLCALGTKPPKRVEGVIAVEYTTESEKSIKDLILWGDTFCTFRQGYPNNSTTHHLGLKEGTDGKYTVRFRIHSGSFLDAEELERLITTCAPKLYDGRSEDGRLIIKSASSMPVSIVTANYLHSPAKKYTVFMDIAPETAVTGSYVSGNLTFSHKGGTTVEWSAPKDGTNEVRVQRISTGAPLYGIGNCRMHTATNRFFIRPETFQVVEGMPGTAPAIEKCNGYHLEFRIDEPLRSVTDNDGNVYRDRYDVTKGRIERVVRCFKVTHETPFESLLSADGTKSYFKIKLPSRILNGAVDTNMLATLKEFNDGATNNRGFIDESGEYYYFKFASANANETTVRNQLKNYPFEIYWHDGTTVREQVEPVSLQPLPGTVKLEVCGFTDVPIRLDYE